MLEAGWGGLTNSAGECSDIELCGGLGDLGGLPKSTDGLDGFMFAIPAGPA